MSFVKRSLSLIPRPIVNLVPREARDRWRTAMLQRERARRRRRATRAEKATQNSVSEDAMRTRAEVEILASAVERIDTRLTEIVVRLDQLDARISTAMSGDAPSALDDLADLIKPIERLQETLENLQVPDETNQSR